MLIECEVWESTGGTIYVGNFGWCEQRKVRKVIDTDLFNWWNEVIFTRSDYGYPYHNQCRVPYKQKSYSCSSITIDTSTLEKIRNRIKGDIIRI